MIRDYWIYQKRGDAMRPWAFYVVKEYDKAGAPISECAFDITAYQDDIPNATHSKSRVGLSGSLDLIVNEAASMVIDVCEFTSDDFEQLRTAFADIVTDSGKRRRTISNR